MGVKFSLGVPFRNSCRLHVTCRLQIAVTTIKASSMTHLPLRTSVAETPQPELCEYIKKIIQNRYVDAANFEDRYL